MQNSDPDNDDLRNYLSDGQLFYCATHKEQFERGLDCLLSEKRNVVLAAQDHVCVERYYRYMVTRIATHPNLIFQAIEFYQLKRWIETRRDGTKEGINNGENCTILLIKQATSSSNRSQSIDAEALRELGQLNTQFLLAGLDNLQKIRSQISDFSKKKPFWWQISQPTQKQLSHLLEIGERFNYRFETKSLVDLYQAQIAENRSNDQSAKYQPTDGDTPVLPSGQSGRGTAVIIAIGISGLLFGGLLFGFTQFRDILATFKNSQPERSQAARPITAESNEIASQAKLDLIEQGISLGVTVNRLSTTSNTHPKGSGLFQEQHAILEQISSSKADFAGLAGSCQKSPNDSGCESEIFDRVEQSTNVSADTLNETNPEELVNKTLSKKTSFGSELDLYLDQNITTIESSGGTNEGSISKTQNYFPEDFPSGSLENFRYHHSNLAPLNRILSTTSGNAFIQHGVYPNPEFAQRLIDEFPATGLIFQITLYKDGRLMPTVLSGPYDNMEQAKMATTLFANFDSWIRTSQSIIDELPE